MNFLFDRIEGRLKKKTLSDGLLFFSAVLPILYLSRYIIENRADYYRLLLGVTERQDWESWVIYILDGVADTADWTVSKIDAIRRLFEQTRRHIRTHAQGIYTHELVNLLFEQPYTRIANLEAAGIAKRQTASKYLKELSDIGVLQEIAIGRDKLFIHPRLMELLRGEGNSFTSF